VFQSRRRRLLYCCGIEVSEGAKTEVKPVTTGERVMRRGAKDGGIIDEAVWWWRRSCARWKLTIDSCGGDEEIRSERVVASSGIR